MNEILRVNNLSKSFGKNKVLQDFDLTLQKGKVYGLLGKNGEGKTTLIRIIMGVIPYDQGEITYKNKKISFRDDSYKREIGFIAEESIFFSWMTIQELLNFNASFYPKWNTRKVDEYLDRLSLDNEFAFVKDMQVYRDHGDDWIRPQHEFHVRLFFLQHKNPASEILRSEDGGAL